jgi:hypothetical protein
MPKAGNVRAANSKANTELNRCAEEDNRSAWSTDTITPIDVPIMLPTSGLWESKTSLSEFAKAIPEWL